MGILALACLALAGPVAAQTAFASPPVDPGESAVVQSLEVVGRYPGPPLWTVRRGGGEVVVMGALSPLPHSLAWNSHRLERLMAGARQVLVPPTGRIGVWDALYILTHGGDLRLSGGQTLWDRITPDQRRRFEALVKSAKTDDRRYDRLKPAPAALLLEGDLVKAMGFSTAKPGTTVKRLADAQRIPVRAEGGIPVVQVFRAMTRMSDAANGDCFAAVLDATERLQSQGRAVAEAWSVGDLAAVRRSGEGDDLDRCVAGTAGLQSFRDKLTRDAAAAIDRALTDGGRTVAVVDLHLLLRPDGVLDRLKAGGAAVDAAVEPPGP